MRSRLVTLLVVLLASAAHGPGVSAAESKPNGKPAAEAPRTADEAMRAGREALRLYREDMKANHGSLIDAAVAFAQAQRLLSKSGDEDLTIEAQSNLFWCKKQMDLADVQVYLAREKGEKGEKPEKAATTPTAAPPPVVVAQPPPPVEPARPRLPAPAPLPSVADDTYFTALGNQPATRVAPPPDARMKRLRNELRERHAAEYRRDDASGRHKLGAALLAEAAATRDTDSAYTLLLETSRLAQENSDLACLLLSARGLGAGFTGAQPVELLRQQLPRFGVREVVPAVTTLIERPRDPAANLAVGRHLCFTDRDWTTGLPLLRIASDAELAALATADLAVGTAPAARRALADRWYDRALHRADEVARQGMCDRAAYWYRQVLKDPQAGGALVRQRLGEIDQVVPVRLDEVDWSDLSVALWDRLPGKVVYALPGKERIGPLTTLFADEHMRLVPHPTATWTMRTGASQAQSGFAGLPGIADSQPLPFAGFPLGALLQKVGEGKPAPCGEVVGPGPLLLLVNHAGGGVSGEMRLKLVPISAPAAKPE